MQVHKLWVNYPIFQRIQCFKINAFHLSISLRLLSFPQQKNIFCCWMPFWKYWYLTKGHILPCEHGKMWPWQTECLCLWRQDTQVCCPRTIGSYMWMQFLPQDKQLPQEELVPASGCMKTWYLRDLDHFWCECNSIVKKQCNMPYHLLESPHSCPLSKSAY